MSLENETLQKLAEAISNLNATATTATVPQAPEVQAVSVKLPEFWPDDPEVWFIRVEAQLRSRAITQDQTRFDYVVAALDNRAIVEIKAVLTIAVPAGGAGGAIAPPSFEDLGKIKIFRAVRRKYLGKTIVFRAAI